MYLLPVSLFLMFLYSSRKEFQSVEELDTYLNDPGKECIQNDEGGNLSIDLAKGVSVESDGKSFHHYERNYGLKPLIDRFYRFTKLKNLKENPVFVYRERQFGEGLIEI